MIVALIFIISATLAVFLIYRSPMRSLSRALLVVAIVAFSLLAYVLASHTGISPFGSPNVVYFGATSPWLSIVIAIFGSTAGVAGSYFFNLGDQAIRWRSMARPLATAPLVLIPTVKLVEASGEQNALALILLFALSYQNGFFWERLLKPA